MRKTKIESHIFLIKMINDKITKMNNTTKVNIIEEAKIVIGDINPFETNLKFPEFIKRAKLCEKYEIDLIDTWTQWYDTLVKRGLEGKYGEFEPFYYINGYMYDFDTKFKLSTDDAIYALHMFAKIFERNPTGDYYIVKSVILCSVDTKIRGHETFAEALKLYRKIKESLTK